MTATVCSATIGFNAAGLVFENNEYTTNEIACSSLPHSNITNVIYRLSENNEEFVIPSKLLTIYPNTVRVQWCNLFSQLTLLQSIFGRLLLLFSGWFPQLLNSSSIKWCMAQAPRFLTKLASFWMATATHPSPTSSTQYNCQA